MLSRADLPTETMNFNTKWMKKQLLPTSNGGNQLRLSVLGRTLINMSRSKLGQEMVITNNTVN
jgi:hypothetical protein